MMNQYYVCVILESGMIDNEYCVGETAMEARNDYLKWLRNNYLEENDVIIGTITECINWDI